MLEKGWTIGYFTEMSEEENNITLPEEREFNLVFKVGPIFYILLLLAKLHYNTVCPCVTCYVRENCFLRIIVYYTSLYPVLTKDYFFNPT